MMLCWKGKCFPRTQTMNEFFEQVIIGCAMQALKASFNQQAQVAALRILAAKKVQVGASRYRPN